MTLTESQRKMLTEFIGECWHDNAEVHPYPNHPEEFYSRCRTCNVDEYHENRTFLTWPDLGACMDALVREGKWELFIFHTLKPNRMITEWSAWLFHPVNEAGEAHFCALVAEFLEAKENERSIS